MWKTIIVGSKRHFLCLRAPAAYADPRDVGDTRVAYIAPDLCFLSQGVRAYAILRLTRVLFTATRNSFIRFCSRLMVEYSKLPITVHVTRNCGAIMEYENKTFGQIHI